MKQFKGFILGLAVAFGLMAVPVVADTVQKTIDVFVDYVNVTVNGEAKQVKNFLHDGTTYIALRDVYEVLGYNVGWDGETKTASITSSDYVEDVVMTVNGTKISGAKFKRVYDAMFAYNQQTGNVLTEDKLIGEVKKELATQAVVNAKAKEFNVDNTSKVREQIEAELSAMDMSYGKDVVDQMLSQYYGFESREKYIEYVLTSELNYNVLTYMQKNMPEYKAAEAEAESYYKEHKEEYKKPSVQVKHILIPTTDLQTGAPLSADEVKAAEALAKDIAKKATASNFDTLIKENNNDPGQPAEGYLVEENSNFVEEFEKAALALTKVGEISQPVLTPYGYHIIMATAINEYVPFESFLNEYLDEKYAEINMQIIERWISEAEIFYDEQAIIKVIK